MIDVSQLTRGLRPTTLIFEETENRSTTTTGETKKLDSTGESESRSIRCLGRYKSRKGIEAVRVAYNEIVNELT